MITLTCLMVALLIAPALTGAVCKIIEQNEIARENFLYGPKFVAWKAAR